MRYWQTNKQLLKLLKVLTTLSVVAFALLYLLPLGLFRIPSVQTRVAQEVSKLLGEVFDTPVQIGRVDLLRWTDVEVHEVQIQDSTRAELLRAKRLIGGISLLELAFQRKLRITSARLFDASLHLRQDSSGRWNIQHTIDHLSRPKPSGESLPVDINSIVIRDMGLWVHPFSSAPLHLSKLSAQLRRLHFSKEYIAGAIDAFSFESNKGLNLSALTGQVALQQDQLQLTNLQLALGASKLSLPLLSLRLKERGLKLLQAVVIGRSQLQPSDFAAVLPALKDFHEELQLHGSLQRKEGSKDASLQGALSLSNPKLLEAVLQGQLQEDSLGRLTSLRLQAEQLSLTPLAYTRLTPLLSAAQEQQLRPLAQLLPLSYTGQLTLVPKKSLQSQGLLRAAVGSLSYEGRVELAPERIALLELEAKTEGLNLAPLFPNSKAPLTKLATTLKVHAEQLSKSPNDWQLTADATLPQLDLLGNHYEGLQLSVRPLARYRHELTLVSNTAPAQLRAKVQGSWRSEGWRDLVAELQLNQFALAPLLPKLAVHGERLSGNIHVALSQLQLEQASGELQASDLQLQSNKHNLQLSQLKCSSQQTEGGGRRLSLATPFMSAGLEGAFTYAGLWRTLRRQLLGRFPSLPLQEVAPIDSHEAPCEAALSVFIRELPEEYVHWLRLPFRLERPLELEARLSSQSRFPELSLHADSVTLGANGLSRLQLDLDEGALVAGGDFRLGDKANFRGVLLRSVFATDSLLTALDLGQGEDGISHGKLVLGLRPLRLAPQAGQTKVRFGLAAQLHASQVRIHNQQWHIAPASLRYTPGSVDIHGVDFKTEGRQLTLSGRLGSAPEDQLQLALQSINLRYILESVGVGFDMLDTDLTGQVTAQLAQGVLQAKGAVTAPSFFVKGVDVGALKAGLSFDSHDGRILLDAQVAQAHGGKADVTGYIRPAGGAGLDLHFDAERLKVDFVGRFMDTLFERLEGQASGKVRLFGVFEQGVTLEGEALTQDASLGVRLLGTRYHFSDTIRFRPNSIEFPQLEVRDDQGHQGLLRGTIKHEYFDKFELDLHASQMAKMKVLQTTHKGTLPFFGTAYGSGTASLRGKLPKLELEVNLRSEEGTDVVLDFTRKGIKKEDKLFTTTRLRPGEQETAPSSDSLRTQDAEETQLAMRLALQVTPQAQLALRLGGSETSNEVKARCEGNLNVEVPYSGDATTYGSLSLKEGTYVYNFEQLAYKRFSLTEGGRLDFRGDPLEAGIQLSARYALKANISDLDSQLSTETKRTFVPINCVLKLSGVISHPDIHLGIELPGAEPELERRIHSLISTEDEKTRQVFYLLALGRFYTPQTLRGTRSTSDSFTSFAASTLSDQLSHLLGNLSQNIRLGTNIRTNNTAFEDTDLELMFSSSWLGDRLLINGNLGYHNNPFLQGKYIGEFDLEYKLNASGTLRLKGYNHYNHMYQYLRQSLTTQGIGFLFQKRFDSLSELFSRRKPQLQRSDSSARSPAPR